MHFESRVLVVDDSPSFRSALKSALEAAGMQVFEASEGIEALWRVRNERAFDLLVVDVHMPTMDGLSFIRELKAMPTYVHTPVVVVTADGSRERRLEGRSLGTTAWLLKPPDMGALVKSILAALHRGTPSDPERSRAAG